MEKRRVNIRISSELHERARALADRLPGGTFSALVEEALEVSLPVMEMATSAFEQHLDDHATAKKVYVNDVVAHAIHTLFDFDLEEVEQT